jgi:quercetin dioxygenase-like cupin family protein
MKYFNNHEERENKELFPGVRSKTFWSNNMLLSVLEMDPGTVVPMHSHPHEQAGTVYEGEFEMTIGDETKTMRPGDTYLIPGGVEHGVTIGDKLVKALDIFSPVREEYK